MGISIGVVHGRERGQFHGFLRPRWAHGAFRQHEDHRHDADVDQRLRGSFPSRARTARDSAAPASSCPGRRTARASATRTRSINLTVDVGQGRAAGRSGTGLGVLASGRGVLRCAERAKRPSRQASASAGTPARRAFPRADPSAAEQSSAPHPPAAVGQVLAASCARSDQSFIFLASLSSADQLHDDARRAPATRRRLSSPVLAVGVRLVVAPRAAVLDARPLGGPPVEAADGIEGALVCSRPLSGAACRGGRRTPRDAVRRPRPAPRRPAELEDRLSRRVDYLPPVPPCCALYCVLDACVDELAQECGAGGQLSGLSQERGRCRAGGSGRPRTWPRRRGTAMPRPDLSVPGRARGSGCSRRAGGPPRQDRWRGIVGGLRRQASTTCAATRRRARIASENPYGAPRWPCPGSLLLVRSRPCSSAQSCLASWRARVWACGGEISDPPEPAHAGARVPPGVVRARRRRARRNRGRGGEGGTSCCGVRANAETKTATAEAARPRHCQSLDAPP